MIKIIKVWGIVGFLIVTMATMTIAQDLESIITGIQDIGGIMDVFQQMMTTLYPPELHEVKIEPEKPTASDNVKVTAVLYNDYEKTDDETTEAYIEYSTDGGKTWAEAEMEQQDDEKTWIGTIPAQKSETEVIYYLKAEDTAGNMYVELPCKVTEWPPEEGKCMFDTALDDDPADDDSKIVPDDMDILGAKIGYDDKYVYLNPILQSEATGGTSNPINIHVYISLIIPTAAGDIMDLAKQSYIAIYAPLAAVGNFEPCMTTYAKGTKAVMDTGNTECKVIDKQLYFRIGRKFGDKELKPPFKILGGATGAALSLSMGPTSGSHYDHTHFTLVNEITRSYKVE